MKVTIDKELLDKLLASIEPIESNWVDNVPEKHRKFAAYWDELGRPELQANCKNMTGWVNIIPDWNENLYYRIKDDPNWELRLKWINSDKTLPIEYFEPSLDKWLKDVNPDFSVHFKYREAKPWYEQEISEKNPILLRWHKMNMAGLWVKRPVNCDEFEPLTDQEIDALKRGF